MIHESPANSRKLRRVSLRVGLAVVLSVPILVGVLHESADQNDTRSGPDPFYSNFVNEHLRSREPEWVRELREQGFGDLSEAVGSGDATLLAVGTALRFVDDIQNGRLESAYDRTTPAFRSRWSREAWQKLPGAHPELGQELIRQRSSIASSKAGFSFVLLYEAVENETQIEIGIELHDDGGVFLVDNLTLSPQ